MTSIRDIAKIAGVSPASVSRILNNDPTFHINEAARGRVIEIARKLNHNKANKKRGPKVLPFHQTDLANYGAVIIEGEMTAAVIEQIQNINPNVIFLDVNTNIRGCNIVRNDFIEATTNILDTLYEMGHRNIAYIGGKSAVVNLDGKIVLRKDDLREDGYIAWMKMHNLDQYCHIFTANWSADEALEATNQLLQLKDRPTAIVVASDPMALGVYKALNDANVNIPNDISVASFDDVEINRFLAPTLSSSDMNTEEMGKATIRFICFRQLTY